MKKALALMISMMMTLLLLCGTLTAYAEYGIPEEVTLNTTEETENCYLTEVSFSVLPIYSNGITYENFYDFVFRQEEIILINGSGGTLKVALSGEMEALGDGFVAFSVFGLDWEDADPGEYFGIAVYSFDGQFHDVGEGDVIDKYKTFTGDIELKVTKEAAESSQESSEESSEPEESSEESSEVVEESSEGSSEVEEESSEPEESEEESSEAESEAEESSESSKTSKPRNPGKPDELNMGGSVGTSGGGKPAPDTGFGNAPLAALGLIAISALAVLAFRKK